VKFVDADREAWLNTAHPISGLYLTRRIRAGTLWKVSRGP
jgi:hypothetical protein